MCKDHLRVGDDGEKWPPFHCASFISIFFLLKELLLNCNPIVKCNFIFCYVLFCCVLFQVAIGFHSVLCSRKNQ